MGYLYDKLVYWLCLRQDVRRARLIADRLGLLLASANPEMGLILAEGCWALVHETHGDVAKAIAHRDNEIGMIRHLHKISQDTAGAAFVFRQYSHADLSDRLDLLAELYHEHGNLDQALSTFQESKQLCEKNGIKFDGADLIQEYLKEKKTDKRAARSAGSLAIA